MTALRTTAPVTCTAYDRLIELLTSCGADYRLIEHMPEGQTARASEVRGHALAQAAKCIVVRIKIGKKTVRYVLAVIPGDRRVDLDRLKQLYGGTYASFATVETAERLAGSISGTIIPFSFLAELELIVDPSLLANETIFFNAAKLDLSVELNAKDYLKLSNPRIEPIAQVVPSIAEVPRD